MAMAQIDSSQFRLGNSHALTLTVIALLISLLLAATKWVTHEQIIANEQLRQQQLLLQLFPDGTDNNPFSHSIEFTDPARGPLKAYPLTGPDGIQAVIVDTYANDGYNGRIEMLIAIKKDLSIAGVRVTRHLETPGLGDDIDHRKSDWITTFTGKSLERPLRPMWSVRKDGGEFDQFTGATVTPRAVVKTVHDTLVTATEHFDILFKDTKP